MKKLNIYFLVLSLIIVLSIGFIGQATISSENDTVNSISEKLIRFHVLANSNSEEDQELKMKVKNEVIKFVTPILKDIKSLDQAREILIEKSEEIDNLATNIIIEEGYDYEVNISLGKENFPVKKYGNVVLPQGEYEAFRVLIGEAEGENWWCVMFPPLCFVDVTKGQVSYEETEEKMSEVLTTDELDEVIFNDEEDNDNIVFKFKLFDMFKKNK